MKHKQLAQSIEDGVNPEGLSDDGSTPWNVWVLQHLTKTSSFMQEILTELYRLAERQHKSWMVEQQKMRERHSKSIELQLRMQPGAEVDKFGSPHLLHINQCLTIINEVELNHKGLFDQKYLSEQEKYRLAVFFMKLLEDPAGFPFLEKLSGGNKSEALRVDKRINLTAKQSKGFRDIYKNRENAKEYHELKGKERKRLQQATLDELSRPYDPVEEHNKLVEA